MSKLTHNRSFIMKGYLSKFEISRLNFAYHGGLHDMNQAKA
jgi:hypothetical protein